MAQKRRNIKYHFDAKGDLIISRKRYVKSIGKDEMHNIKCKQRMTIVEHEGVYCERTLRVGERTEIYCIGYQWKPDMRTVLRNRR